MKTLLAASLAIITLLSASGPLAAATPEQEKAFLEAVKKAYEADDEKTLKSFLYTVGADPQLVDMWTMMLTSGGGLGKPITSIELVPMTPKQIKDEEDEPYTLPDGRVAKFLPILYKHLKIITKYANGATDSLDLLVGEKDGKLVIPVPVIAK